MEHYNDLDVMVKAVNELMGASINTKYDNNIYEESIEDIFFDDSIDVNKDSTDEIDKSLFKSLNEVFSKYNLKFTSFKTVEAVGGEDKGYEYYKIVEFINDDQKIYVQFDGSYYSYAGSTFNKCYIVVPKEVTVTKYFAI